MLGVRMQGEAGSGERVATGIAEDGRKEGWRRIGRGGDREVRRSEDGWGKTGKWGSSPGRGKWRRRSWRGC